MTSAASVATASVEEAFACRNCDCACVEDRVCVFQYRTVAAEGFTRWKKQSYIVWRHIGSGVEKCTGDRTLYAWPGPVGERRSIREREDEQSWS